MHHATARGPHEKSWPKLPLLLFHRITNLSPHFAFAPIDPSPTLMASTRDNLNELRSPSLPSPRLLASCHHLRGRPRTQLWGWQSVNAVRHGHGSLRAHAWWVWRMAATNTIQLLVVVAVVLHAMPSFCYRWWCHYGGMKARGQGTEREYKFFLFFLPSSSVVTICCYYLVFSYPSHCILLAARAYQPLLP